LALAAAPVLAQDEGRRPGPPLRLVAPRPGAAAPAGVTATPPDPVGPSCATRARGTAGDGLGHGSRVSTRAAGNEPGEATKARRRGEAALAALVTEPVVVAVVLAALRGAGFDAEARARDAAVAAL